MSAADENSDPWTTLSEDEVYRNPWISVRHRRVLDPSGAPGIYGIVRFAKRAIGVLPLGADGRVRLVGQWRVPFGRYSWEIPEGGAEAGESDEAAARRELEEEAGLRAGTLREILQMDLSNSVTDERALLFLATDLATGRFAPDSTEALRQRDVPFRALLEEARAGQVTDAMTIAAVQTVYYMACEGLLEPELAAAALAR